jgi:hypothetical protein
VVDMGNGCVVKSSVYEGKVSSYDLMAVGGLGGTL